MAKVLNPVTNVGPDGTHMPPVHVDGSNYLAAGSARTLTVAEHMSTIKLDTSGSSTVTLPAATGAGTRFRFVVDTAATSPNHSVKVANASDTMQGVLVMVSQLVGNVAGFRALAGTSDTIKLNATTLGGQVGDSFEVQDTAANEWTVSGILSAVGTPVTPFSATVS
jgi:hypothetical protein